MIKKTLYFGNPAYLSLQNGQLVLRLPEVEKNDSIPSAWKQHAERTIPVEDIGVVLLDHRVAASGDPETVFADEAFRAAFPEGEGIAHA